METLYRIGREDYGLSAEEINSAIKESGTSFIVPEDLQGKVRFLYQLAEIAFADDQLDDSERKLMCKYAKRMGFLDENIDGIVDYLLQQAKDKRPIADVINDITKSE